MFRLVAQVPIFNAHSPFDGPPDAFAGNGIGTLLHRTLERDEGGLQLRRPGWCRKRDRPESTIWAIRRSCLPVRGDLRIVLSVDDGDGGIEQCCG
jgi:hypothetical protein